MTTGSELPIGTEIAGLVLGEVLGRGAHAVVHEAVDPRGRRVAIKLRRSGDADQDRRFLREFESIRRLRLPGVVRVFEAGTHGAWTWFTMERVDGQDLQRWIAQGGDLEERVRRACEAGARLCETLARVHQAGLVHRDLKPSNVLVTGDGRVRVLDFGVVQWWALGDTLTRRGGLLGTPAFMAPEQVCGLPVWGAADIFGLGLMLYEGVGGRRPKPGSAAGWLAQQVLDRVPALVTRLPRVDRRFSSTLERTLAFDPVARPSALELAELLRGCVHGTTPADWPEPAVFVSRDEDLRALETTLQGDGPPLVVLSGPTGSGRHRLLEQGTRRAALRGFRSVSGRCRVDGLGAGVGEVLERLLGTRLRPRWLDDLAREHATALLQMWPALPLQTLSEGPPEQPADRRAVARAAAEVILAAAREDPLVLVLDGFGELDGLTARVLDRLLRHGRDRVVTVAVLDPRRSGKRARRVLRASEEAGLVETLRLEDLDAGSCEAIAADLCPSAPPGHPSGGPPLAGVQAGLRALAELRGEPFVDIDPRAARLAVVDAPLPAPVLQALAGPLPPLIQAGFVVEGVDRRYRVAGPSFQRAADAALEDPWSAHDALADAWNASDDPARWLHVARHRVRGAGGLRSWEAAVQAALSAEHTGRFQLAREWLLLLDDLPKERRSAAYLRLRFQLAACRARIAAVTDTERPREDLVRGARARARTPQDLAVVAWLEAELAMRRGAVGAALDQAATAARDAEDSAPAQSARLWLTCTRASLDLGRVADAQNACGHALRVARELRDPLVHIDVAALQAEIALSTEEPGFASERCRWGLSASERHDYPHGIAAHSQVLATVLMRGGQRRQAEEAMRRARSLFAQHGARGEAGATAIHLAALALGRGEAGPARLWLDEGLATVRKLHRDRLLPEALAVQLQLAVLDCDEARAEETRQAYGRLRRRDPSWLLAELVHARSRNDLVALRALAQESQGSGYVAAMAQLELARARLQAGDAGGAGQALSLGLELAEAEDMRELLEYAELLAGAIQPHRAVGWESRVDAAMRARWVELFLGALEFDGRRRAALGDLEGAEERYRSLGARAREMGHGPYARTAAHLLAMHCETTVPML